MLKVSDRWLSSPRNEGLSLYRRINLRCVGSMDTTKRSTAVASSRAARQYLRWAKGAVRFWSLFKVIFGIRDFYLHRWDQRQNDACSRLLTSVSETPQGPDAQGGDCMKKMQWEVASVHTKLSRAVSKSNLFDRESVETPLLTCLSPTLPTSTETCS